jgi:hypothetical protein
VNPTSYLIYADNGRQISKVTYADGSVTYTDIGPDGTGSPNGTVLGQGTYTSDGQPVASSSGGVGNIAGFGSAPIVNQGFNIFGVTSPIDLSPLIHQPAAWVILAGIGVAFWAGNRGGGRRLPVGYY